MTDRPARFDYSSIPEGYYQHVIESGTPVRRAWHLQKFERVLESLPNAPGQSILDIGCFAGTFLSRLPREVFDRQVGVDILENQIRYANEHFATPFRSFRHVERISNLGSLGETFDCVTLIEVIEHLAESEVREMFRQAAGLVKRGGHLVLSTPNYASAWPLLEIAVNLLSEVSYKEQHITKFDSFSGLRKLRRIAPELFEEFELEFKTTTHFLAPFLAAFSLEASMRLSRAVLHRRWRNPFGNLILLSFTRR